MNTILITLGILFLIALYPIIGIIKNIFDTDSLNGYMEENKLLYSAIAIIVIVFSFKTIYHWIIINKH